MYQIGKIKYLVNGSLCAKSGSLLLDTAVWILMLGAVIGCWLLLLPKGCAGALLQQVCYYGAYLLVLCFQGWGMYFWMYFILGEFIKGSVIHLHKGSDLKCVSR